MGSLAAVATTAAAVEQTISLNNGWTWISLNVEAPDMSVSSVFATVGPSIVQIKDQRSFTDYYEGYGFYGRVSCMGREEYSQWV